MSVNESLNQCGGENDVPLKRPENVFKAKLKMNLKDNYSTRYHLFMRLYFHE